MKKNIFFALLVMGVTSVYGMDSNEIEHWQTKITKPIKAAIYALSLDWCENQLGMVAQLANEHLNEQALTNRCKEIGHCGSQTGRIVQGTCGASALCCAAFTCYQAPCVGACGCAGCALVGRKLYVMRKYGLASKQKHKKTE